MSQLEIQQAHFGVGSEATNGSHLLGSRVTSLVAKAMIGETFPSLSRALLKSILKTSTGRNLKPACCGVLVSPGPVGWSVWSLGALKGLKGVGEKTVQKLEAIGVLTFPRLAQMTDEQSRGN